MEPFILLKKGAAIFWAILKGSDDESSLVYINIIVIDDNVDTFAKFSVLAADPFSKEDFSFTQPTKIIRIKSRI